MISELDILTRVLPRVKSQYRVLTELENYCIKGIGSLQERSSMHKRLLLAYYEFYLNTQQPSANPYVRIRILKYAIPGRLWRHGIHSFLEHLRGGLPRTSGHLSRFLHFAYDTVTLLCEADPTLENLWQEMRGNLGRYGMMIQQFDPQECFTWSLIARHCYGKVAAADTTQGRLYHHLAIIETPDHLKQLYYWSRSLTSIQCFRDSRESMKPLLVRTLERNHRVAPRLRRKYEDVSRLRRKRELELEQFFIKTHSTLFLRRDLTTFDRMSQGYFKRLNKYLVKPKFEFLEDGIYHSMINITALFGYGESNSNLRKVYDIRFEEEMVALKTTAINDRTEHANSSISKLIEDAVFLSSLRFTISTFRLILCFYKRYDIHTFCHILLVFIHSLIKVQEVCDCAPILDRVPWKELATFLNYWLLRSEFLSTEIQERSIWELLPEDDVMRGQIWTIGYFPNLQRNKVRKEKEECPEISSTKQRRIDRMLWIAIELSQVIVPGELGIYANQSQHVEQLQFDGRFEASVQRLEE